MKQDIIEIIKLTADEGTVLTNGEAYGKEVYLGVNSSSSDWVEITEERYKEILEEKLKEEEKLNET